MQRFCYPCSRASHQVAWGAGFRKYLLRNKEVTFRCNDTRYHVKIEDVEVYAQGFAAIAENLRDYGENIVVDIGEKDLKAIGECATEYTEKIMRKIREYGYNEELAKLHFLGVSAMLMKHFAKLDKDKVHFIEDIKVNAKGYECSNQRRIRKLRQR